MENNTEGLITLVVAQGLRYYQSLDHIYTPQELAVLWSEHRLGEWFFRLNINHAHIIDTELRHMTKESDIEVVGPVIYEKVRALHDAISEAALQETKARFKHMATFAPKGERVNLQVVVDWYPSAMLPYAMKAVPGIPNEELSVVFDVNPQRLQAFRECPDEELHLLGKALLTEPFGGFLVDFIRDMAEHFVGCGIEKSFYYPVFIKELQTIRHGVLDRCHERMLFYQAAGRPAMADVYSFYEKDTLPDEIELTQAAARQMPIPVEVDTGLIELSNTYATACYPLDDTAVSETAHLIDKYLVLLAGE